MSTRAKGKRSSALVPGSVSCPGTNPAELSGVGAVLALGHVCNLALEVEDRTFMAAPEADSGPRIHALEGVLDRPFW